MLFFLFRHPLPYYFALALVGLTACAPDFQTDEHTYKFFLDQDIRNVSTGYYQRYYGLVDTARWTNLISEADTVVPPDAATGLLKFRSAGIWYEAKEGPDGLRAEQQYPGWEPRHDSVDFHQNLMIFANRQPHKVDIPAADIVLNGDSIRFAIIHPTEPAYDWNFREQEIPSDHLLLTTYGNDTLPISLSMDGVGAISRQTVFRVGRHSYVLRYFTPEYDGVIIEQLPDRGGLPYTAELDLNYRPIPVEELDGTPATINRTPGRELLIYFWAGFDNEIHLQQIDSLYQALPTAEQEKLEIVFIAQFNLQASVRAWVAENNIRLPVYYGTRKTCLRLNCSSHLPYYVAVDGRGRFTSFYNYWEKLEARLRAQAR